MTAEIKSIPADKDLLDAIARLTEVLNTHSMNSDSAAQVLLSIVPLIAVVFGVTILFFFMLWRYKITKELIKAGQYNPTSFRNFRAFR